MLRVDSAAMPDSDWYRLQRIIAGFETSWKRGDRPQIAEYLSPDEPHRGALLLELVHAELEFRLKAGEAARVEEYLRKFPQLARDRSTVLGLIKTEWAFRRRREANLSLERYRDRFPGLHDELEGSRSSASTVHSHQASGQIASNASAMAEPPLPRRLGKFELREKLGTGSFGVVYRAWDTLLKRQVAVKVPRPDVMAAQPDLLGFVREARNAIHLQHPNIVAIFDASPIEDTVCVVRAFIEGTTLAERIRDASFTPKESAALMALVADALAYAHSRGIIHRDLKPSNILLDLQGQPLVSDFGLAKSDSGDTTLSPAGQVGILIGTPAYMSPEQARGEGSLVDARSDVFSAGIVLYELLTGSRPFRGRGRMLQLQIQEFTPTAPHLLNDDITHDLETICLKALAKDPADRYQAAKALADDLRKFVDGESVAPIPETTATSGPRTRRGWVPVAALIAICLGLLGMTFAWHQAEKRGAKDREIVRRSFRALLNRASQAGPTGQFDAERANSLRERLWDDLEELVPTLESDPELRELEADVHLRLAEHARLKGSDREAGSHWSRAGVICEALVRERPEDVSRLQDLAHSLANQAALRSRAGLSEESRELYEQSLRRWVEVQADRKRQALARPGDTRAALELAESQLQLSIIQDRLGKVVEVSEIDRIALDLDAAGSLSAVEKSRLARLCLDISRLDLAVRPSYRALKFARLGQRLYQELPLDTGVERGRAWASLAVARANRDLERGPEARKEFEQAAERFEALARSEPSEPELLRQQGAALFEFGQFLNPLVARDRSLSALRKSLKVRQRLNRLNPESPSDLADLAETRAAFASLLEAEGHVFRPAWITLLASIDETRAVALAPGVKSYWSDFAKLTGSLARRSWVTLKKGVGPPSVGATILLKSIKEYWPD